MLSSLGPSALGFSMEQTAASAGHVEAAPPEDNKLKPAPKRQNKKSEKLQALINKGAFGSRSKCVCIRPIANEKKSKSAVVACMTYAAVMVVEEVLHHWRRCSTAHADRALDFVLLRVKPCYTISFHAK